MVVPKGFFPVQDTGVIQGITEAEQSISFTAMAERQQALAHAVLEDPAVAGASTEDLLPAIVFSLSRAAVRETAVGGRFVVESGRHPAQHDIVSRFASLQKRLWQSREP